MSLFPIQFHRALIRLFRRGYLSRATEQCDSEKFGEAGRASERRFRYATEAKSADNQADAIADKSHSFPESLSAPPHFKLHHTINGYMFGNMPMMTMKKGERVPWYLLTLGDSNNFHTVHWHGNTVTLNGHRADVVALLPAQTETVDMIPDNPGIWLFHCHVSDHMMGGMTARYQVLP